MRGCGCGSQEIKEALGNANQVYLGAPNHLVIFSRAEYSRPGEKREDGVTGRIIEVSWERAMQHCDCQVRPRWLSRRKGSDVV